MTFWEKIKFFFSTEGKALLEALFPIIKSEAGKLLAVVKPQAMEIIKSLASTSLSGAEKKASANSQLKVIVENLKSQGKLSAAVVGDKAINFVIEACVTEVLGSGVSTSTTPTSTPVGTGATAAQ